MGNKIIGLAEPFVIRRQRHCIHSAADMFAAPDAPDYPECVYFIGGVTGHIKIGFARNPHSRMYEMQTGSPVKLMIYAYALAPRETEWALHKHFERDRCHGEWFERSNDLLHLIGNVQMQHAKSIGVSLPRKPVEEKDFEL